MICKVKFYRLVTRIFLKDYKIIIFDKMRKFVHDYLFIRAEVSKKNFIYDMIKISIFLDEDCNRIFHDQNGKCLYIIKSIHRNISIIIMKISFQTIIGKLYNSL